MNELQDKLKTKLSYNKELGEVYWIKTTNNVKLGSLTGTINNCGYRIIHFNTKMILVPHVIWFFEYGIFPKELNHIDCNKLNNKISNLEEVTRRENCQRKRIHLEGKLPGCYFHKLSGKWMSRLYYKGINYYLGLYLTEVEANNYYNRKLEELNG